MTIILLVIIYLAFISLGLPDSVLGTAFPAMMSDWNLDLSSAGLVSLIITIGTTTSSFASGFVIKRLGTGKTVLASCIITASALMGISFASGIYWLLLLAIPLGLGAGSVDTALNNFVALHYKARHMNWLHSFWGIGATTGPLIISWNLNHSGWQSGYRTIALIQFSLAMILLLSQPLWKKTEDSAKAGKTTAEPGSPDKSVTPVGILKIRGTVFVMLIMFIYCGVEISIGLWGSSFLIHSRSFSIESAASWMAFYYGGITAGRIISGFISFRLSNTRMIRTGLLISLSGIIMLVFSAGGIVSGLAIILTGLGFAPVFPSMIHETPVRFGKTRSQDIIGYQMGSAGIGAAVFPPLSGIIMQHTGTSLFPFIGLSMVILLIVFTEYVTVYLKKAPEPYSRPYSR